MMDSAQSLSGHIFDSYQNMMQIAACIREAARQRSIPRPRVLELSRRSTGLGDYIPNAQIERFATHENNQPIISSPLRIPFADKSFDVCLISDVYEHVPAELRPELLREMVRVTNGLVLLGAPQGNEIVTRFDRVVFDFIWGKYAERFEPLAQHVGFGVDSVEQTLEHFKAQGATEAIMLPCNYVYRWIHQILIYFDLQYRQPDLSDFEAINKIYNEFLSPYDYREPCYRYLVAISTNPQIDINHLKSKLTAPVEIPEHVATAEGVLLETFQKVDSQLADKLRINSLEITRLNGIISQLQNKSQETTQPGVAQQTQQLLASIKKLGLRGILSRIKSRI